MRATILVLPRSLRLDLAVSAAWALVAVAFALQGHATALYKSTPQP